MTLSRLVPSLFLVLAFGFGLVMWFLPEAGDPAPEVRMTTLDGQQVTLRDLHGKPVLVTFWATSCPSCIAEMPHLAALHEDLHGEGLEIIGVAMHHDPPERVAALVEQRDLPYTIVLDKDRSVARAFGGIGVTPTSYLITPNGRVVQRTIGEFDMAKLRSRVEGML